MKTPEYTEIGLNKKQKNTPQLKRNFNELLERELVLRTLLENEYLRQYKQISGTQGSLIDHPSLVPIARYTE